MTDTFRALRLHKTDTGQEARFEDLTESDLMDGDVTVRVSHSTVNFKDGLALERHGVTPDKGEVVVTGAAGGVGSVAIALLARLGYRVVASSRRKESEGDYLTGLGAVEILDAAEIAGPGRPLARERWAGGV